MAEHANNTGAGLPGLTGERLKAIVTILVTLYSLANAGLNLAGVNTLPFTDEQVSAAIFAVIGVCGTIWGWWKNQNVTSAALAGQQLVDALKREGMGQRPDRRQVRRDRRGQRAGRRRHGRRRRSR